MSNTVENPVIVTHDTPIIDPYEGIDDGKWWVYKKAEPVSVPNKSWSW